MPQSVMRPGDAMDQLSHGGFAATFVRVGAVGDVAVEVFGDRDFGGERRSSFLGPRCSSCLKITLPLSSVISAVRRSHSICSNGVTAESLKTRSKRKPRFFFRRDLGRPESDLRFLTKVAGCRPGLSWIMVEGGC